MKNKVLKISLSVLFVLLISFNLSIKDKKVSINSSLKQEALACRIIPEGVEDYCWDLVYYPGGYDCYPNGIWSCYI